jgi:hypothetical protein
MPTLARRLLISRTPRWREAAILVVVAWLVPFLVHTIPWAGPRPLGVYVLPLFWTSFIAVYFYGALPGLVIGMVAPLVNMLLTGQPELRGLGNLGLEMTLFVTAASLFVTRWPGFWLGAPLAWLAAKASVIAIQFLVPAFEYTGSPVAHLGRSLQNGLTGLGMLAVINWLLAAFYPKGDAWERE